MLMKTTASLLALVLAAGVTASQAADDKPYVEGAVTSVAYIRVKDGKMFDYMAYLNGTWRKEQEAYKKAGLITEYHIYEASPRSLEEPNLILTVTYPNYGALDHQAEFDAVDTRIEGSLKASNQGMAERGAIRSVLGAELVRELMLR